MSLAWIYLIIAGILEWSCPIGLKLDVTKSGYNCKWLSFAGVTMIISGRPFVSLPLNHTSLNGIILL